MNASFPSRVSPLAGTWDVSTESAESSPVPSDDVELMLRMQQKDGAALACLFDRYADLVFHIAFQVLRDQGEAEELVQEVFMNVYRKCGSFDMNKGSVRGWLRRVTYGVAFDRKQYLNNRHFYTCDALEDMVFELRSQCDVEREANERQLESVLRKAMESMTEKQRKTLELSFFGGYTLREISEVQNESLVNTRHYYYRAIDRLRKVLPHRGRKTKEKML
jgi:RNA polymerase sigma-70 factor (ECF subfamily)